MRGELAVAAALSVGALVCACATIMKLDPSDDPEAIQGSSSGKSNPSATSTSGGSSGKTSSSASSTSGAGTSTSSSSGASDAATSSSGTSTSTSSGTPTSGGDCKSDTDCAAQTTKRCREDLKCHDTCIGLGDFGCSPTKFDDCCVDGWCNVGTCQTCKKAGEQAVRVGPLPGVAVPQSCCSRSAGAISGTCD